MISELMINPAAVDDEAGEWLELTSLADYTLDLSGLVLSDDGVDVVSVEGTVELAPGGYAVFCAVGMPANNGGVDCDGSYAYSTTGAGFALAQAGDEVVVSTATGTVLDRVNYSDGFAPTGRSTGVPDSLLSPSGNDNTNGWCPQSGFLSGGDQGTPGAANSGC